MPADLVRCYERLDAVRHPLVIGVEGIFQTDGKLACVVLPRMEHGNLGAFIASDPSLEQFRSVMVQVFAGTAFLHQLGIAHATR